MKKAFLLFAFVMMSALSFAQKGSFSFGPQLGIQPCTEDHGPCNISIGASLRYGFAKSVRGELAIDYGFKDKEVSVFTGAFNLHFLIPASNGFAFYPLVGIGFGNVSGWGDSENKFLFNAGMGGQYRFSRDITGFIEAKYQHMEHFSRVPITIGVQFNI